VTFVLTIAIDLRPRRMAMPGEATPPPLRWKFYAACGV